jgi:hypothetical protein
MLTAGAFDEGKSPGSGAAEEDNLGLRCSEQPSRVNLVAIAA